TFGDASRRPGPSELIARLPSARGLPRTAGRDGQSGSVRRRSLELLDRFDEAPCLRILLQRGVDGREGLTQGRKVSRRRVRQAASGRAHFRDEPTFVLEQAG